MGVGASAYGLVVVVNSVSVSMSENHLHLCTHLPIHNLARTWHGMLGSGVGGGEEAHTIAVRESMDLHELMLLLNGCTKT